MGNYFLYFLIRCSPPSNKHKPSKSTHWPNCHSNSFLDGSTEFHSTRSTSETTSSLAERQTQLLLLTCKTQSLPRGKATRRPRSTNGQMRRSCSKLPSLDVTRKSLTRLSNGATRSRTLP